MIMKYLETYWFVCCILRLLGETLSARLMAQISLDTILYTVSKYRSSKIPDAMYLWVKPGNAQWLFPLPARTAFLLKVESIQLRLLSPEINNT